MKSLFILSIALLAVSCGKDGCSCASCDTVARSPSKYSGHPGAIKPYAAVDNITVRSRDCTGNLCGYWAGATIIAHNPLNKEVGVSFNCTYYLNNGVLGKTYKAKTTVPQRSSRVLEGFDLLFDLPKSVSSNNIYINCLVHFIGFDPTEIGYSVK